MKHLRTILMFGAALLPLIGIAQITPPGYERELKEYEELQKHSFLDRDSVALLDTAIIFDPETFEEMVRVNRSVMSIRDYCTHILNMPKPEVLTQGQPVLITDPTNYEKLLIKWNPAAGKIDTLQPDK